MPTYVKQRDWRSAQDMMKFTDYSVKTGHLTAYWTPSFAQDVLVKASVGQYLAGDKGGTLDISKHFDSGVVVGGYATITNVSPRNMGKGDFTKGVYVSIPTGSLLIRANPQSCGNWLDATDVMGDNAWA